MTTPPASQLSQTSNSLPAVADSTGAATISFEPPNGIQWAVTQIASQIVNSVLTGTLVVKKNGAFICGSSAPALDSADGGFILLKPGDVLSMAWSGLTPNAQCQGTLYYTAQAIQ